MATTSIFVGRKEELAYVDRLVRDIGTNHLVGINAEGSIGKTKFLQKNHEKYKSERRTESKVISPDINVTCTDIMDFDDRSFHSLKNILFEIAHRFGKNWFAEYFDELLNLRKMERAGVSAGRLERHLAEVHEIFIQCFNRLSSQVRVLLFFDTTDALQGSFALWDDFIPILNQLENYVVLIAGRNGRDICERLMPSLVTKIHIIDLQVFTQEESKTYLQHAQKELGVFLEPELQEKLIEVAGGTAILLRLGMDLRRQGIHINWINEESIDQLKALSPEERLSRKRELEEQGVRHLINSLYPINRLRLVLAHVYPIDVKLASKLLKEDIHTTRQIFVEAEGYVSIKRLPDEKISLHDEYRRMIEEYIWDDFDADGEKRRGYSRIAAAYFGDLIEDIDHDIVRIENDASDSLEQFVTKEDLNREKHLLTMQQLDHSLFNDVSEGFTLYDDALNNLIRKREFEFAVQIQSTINRFLKDLDPDERYRCQFLKAKLLSEMARADEAISMLEQLLSDHQDSLVRKAELYHLLARNETSRGRFDEALSHAHACLDMLRELETSKGVPSVIHQIGNIFLRRGEWDKAIDYYQEALQHLLDMEDPSDDDMAGIFSSLGYALGFAGKYSEGEKNCLKAIRIWADAGLEKQLGRGETTLASMYRDHRKYDLAHDYLNRAISRFDEIYDGYWLTRVYFHQAWTFWFEGVDGGKSDPALAQARLQRAKEIFDKSYELAKEYHVQTELPGILHQSSNVYWLLGEKDKARELNDTAYNLSKEMHDIRYQIDSLVGKAEFDLDDEKYDLIPEYAKILAEEYEAKGYHYALFYGRMRRILGDVAYYTQNFSEAHGYYAEGLALIARHGGYGMYSVDPELERLATKIHDLPTSVALEWLNLFKTYWTQHRRYDKSHSLIGWCARTIADVKRRRGDDQSS